VCAVLYNGWGSVISSKYQDNGSVPVQLLSVQWGLTGLLFKKKKHEKEEKERNENAPPPYPIRLKHLSNVLEEGNKQLQYLQTFYNVLQSSYLNLVSHRKR